MSDPFRVVDIICSASAGHPDLRLLKGDGFTVLLASLRIIIYDYSLFVFFVSLDVENLCAFCGFCAILELFVF